MSNVAYDQYIQKLQMYSKEGPNRVTKMGKYLSADLAVKKGEIIEVTAQGSARGEFYYGIIETTGNAVELLQNNGSQRILHTNQMYSTLTTSTLYEAKFASTLSFSVNLWKNDLRGICNIAFLTLLAKVV